MTGFYDTAAGRIYITEKDGRIVYIRPSPPDNVCEYSSSPLIKQAYDEITAYLDGRLKKFSLPFVLSGTPFQQSVYKQLLEIPYGETRSYTDIAYAVGGAGYSRAVGNANNKNPLIFVVPCHRVIRAGGDAGGYLLGGSVKRRLLEMEKNNINIEK